jgi:hypothetical protein
MRETPEEMLIEAISAFDYPSVTYDFVEDREHSFASTRELETHLGKLLWATDAEPVRDGLSGVLYWGHYRVGYRDDRVRKFRATVTAQQLLKAISTFRLLRGPDLTVLRGIELPQFTNMAFLTKLRTFLEPDCYCVLDSKVASLAPLSARLKRQKTYIPVTAQNEQAYNWWVEICTSLAARLHLQPTPRPVDVERGLFHLVDHGSRTVAERLLSALT